MLYESLPYNKNLMPTLWEVVVDFKEFEGSITKVEGINGDVKVSVRVPITPEIVRQFGVEEILEIGKRAGVVRPELVVYRHMGDSNPPFFSFKMTKSELWLQNPSNVVEEHMVDIFYASLRQLKEALAARLVELEVKVTNLLMEKCNA